MNISPEHDNKQMPRKVPTSPEPSEQSSSLPPTVPTSPWSSSLGSSLLNTPAASPPMGPGAANANIELEDDDFVVPTLEISSELDASPILDPTSIVSILDSSDNAFSSDDLLDSILDSDTSMFSSTIPDDTDTSSNLDFVMDLNITLSDMSISDSIDTTDSYLGAPKLNVIDLYMVSGKEEIEDITESTPFTTQVILYGPGGKHHVSKLMWTTEPW
ncbi:hypothetical protein EV702DRAFT_1202572 [Suillus placidus]|uniref:Uncharacterized protein n=1 Tax=Suillus placidus TaxID=48579 RepID=A0A9P7CYB7_9AGAM|nr:hypothetical protein EV702DRAFT_1202572 [Suillus placidus]